MYVPSTEEDGTYAVFTANRDVTPDQAMGLTAQYSRRWQIESEYKSIKNHFLPATASTDYRVRLLYFVLGVVMYNVWRLTNLLLREALPSTSAQSRHSALAKSSNSSVSASLRPTDR